MKPKVDLFIQPPYVLAIPTETVYGLAARIDSELGLRAIFSIKERPFFDPLIVHVSNTEQAKSLTTDWSRAAAILADHFWPGPLTLVLDKQETVSDLITSGLTTVGVRMPRHPLTLKLIEEVGIPLAAPSANKFGKTSPTTPEHVFAEFGSAVPVLDGGACEVGVESTVLRVVSGDDGEHILSLLRPGMITAAEITLVLEQNQIHFHWRTTNDKSSSPGALKHHYMPEIPLIYISTARSSALRSSEPSSGRVLNEKLVAEIASQLKSVKSEVEGIHLQIPENLNIHDLDAISELTLPETPAGAARILYSKLREIAQPSKKLIVFFEKSEHLSGSWEAVRDRLQKASTLIL